MLNNLQHKYTKKELQKRKNSSENESLVVKKKSPFLEQFKPIQNDFCVIETPSSNTGCSLTETNHKNTVPDWAKPNVNQVITLDKLHLTYSVDPPPTFLDPNTGKKVAAKRVERGVKDSSFLYSDCPLMELMPTNTDSDIDRVVLVTMCHYLDMYFYYPEYQYSSQFRNKCEVWVKGEKFCTILFVPTSTAVYRPTDVKLEIYNAQLYSGDWLVNLIELENLLGLKLKSVARLDIAIDMLRTVKINRKDGIVNFLDSVNLAVRTRQKRRAKLKGRTQVRGIGDLDKEGKYTSFLIGKKGGEAFLRIYNKSLELKAKETEKENELGEMFKEWVQNPNSDKSQYIPAFWEVNGLDHTKGVDRLEVSLSAKRVKKIKDFDLYRLIDPTYLAMIMRTMLEKEVLVDGKRGKGFGMFEFVNVTGEETNISRLKTISIIDWEKLGGGKFVDTKPLVQNGTLWRVKTAFKRRCEEYFRYGDKKALESIKTECERPEFEGMELRKYVARKWMEWISDFVKQDVLDGKMDLVTGRSICKRELIKLDDILDLIWKPEDTTTLTYSDITQIAFADMWTQTSTGIVDALTKDNQFTKRQAQTKIEELVINNYIKKDSNNQYFRVSNLG